AGTCAHPDGPVLNVCSPDFPYIERPQGSWRPCVASLDRFRHQGHEHMGELISLAERRAARAEAHAPPVRPRVSFYFDLASPWTYLAAERVDQRFADVRWVPAIGDALPGGRDAAAQREAVEGRADELRMPLVWPEPVAMPGRSA